MIKYVVLLSVICVVKAQSPPHKPRPTRPTTPKPTTVKIDYDEPTQCEGVIFDLHIRNKTFIYYGVTRIIQMVYNVKPQKLYFIYGYESDRKVAFIKFAKKESRVLHVIKNPTCLAVNQRTRRVFVGTTDGIYIANGWVTGNPERIPLRGNYGAQISVQSMHVEGHMTYGGRQAEVLYFTDSNNRLWTFENGLVNTVEELAGVHIEKIVCHQDVILFTQHKTLFLLRLGEFGVYTYKEHIGDVNILTTDTSNKPYIATDDGVYELDTRKTDNSSDMYKNFKRVSNITGLTALTFNEAGEPIYTTEDEFVYLRYQGCYLPFE